MKFKIFCWLLLFLFLPISGLITQAQITFLQPPTFAGSGNGFIADFNRDGKLDMLISDGTMNLGNGDGTFTKGTSVAGAPVLAVGDFNGDGKPDALEQGTGTLLVLLGNGDGTFQSAISTASGASLTLLTAIDLNGDGKVDIVGYFNGAILVYISKGDGTFQPAVSYNISAPAAVLTVGDFNGDGKLDIGVSISNQEIVLLGNGDGTLRAPKTSSGSVYSPSYVVVADFNGDNKLDLAISGCNSTCGTYISLGNGDGTFQPSSLLFLANGPLAAGDVNGDGNQDLIVGSTDNAAVMIFQGKGDGTFSNTANYSYNSLISVADFNGDGKLDIASQNEILLGNGDGSFQGTVAALATPVNNASVVVGDFEKSGKPDIAIVSASTVYIFHNTGDTLSQSHAYTLHGPGAGIVRADFNGDGKLDLVVFGTDSSHNWNYSVLLGNGDGSFQAPVYYPQSVQVTANMSYGAVVADFNNDHKLDIAVDSGNQTLAVLLGNGDGTFAAPAYYYDAGDNLTGGADFNSDGKLDLLAVNGILYGNGDGTFQPVIFPSNLANFPAAFVADLNNDGIPDLLSAGAQAALGNGDGTFLVLPPPLTGVSEAGYFVNAVADMNGDGIPDAVAAYYTSVSIQPRATNTGVLLGNGDGTFSALVDVPTNGVLPIYGLLTSTLVLIADMNGDGRPDILYNPQGGIAALLNTTQAGQPDFKISATQLSPSPVVTGSTSTSTLLVSPLNGFSGEVTLACANPSGFSCTFSPTTISGGSGTSTISVTVSILTGQLLVNITGVSGNISRGAAVPLTVDNDYSSDFQISTTSPSPATVVPGGSATATVKVTSLSGFTNAVSLACVVPGSSGSACSLNPTSVTPSGTPSTLTINTSTGAASGMQVINVYGTSGSAVYGAGLALAISPDFTIGAASGSKTSQTINAGGTANFSVVLAAAPSFSGTANLTCAITPVVTPAPTCTLSNSSVQLSGDATQTVTVTIATTAPMTSRTLPLVPFSPKEIPMVFTFTLLTSLCFWLRTRKRWSILFSPPALLGLLIFASCGGGGGTTSHTSPGTPAGTYTAAVTATSGSISHPMTLQVVVQ